MRMSACLRVGGRAESAVSSAFSSLLCLLFVSLQLTVHSCPSTPTPTQHNANTTQTQRNAQRQDAITGDAALAKAAADAAATPATNPSDGCADSVGFCSDFNKARAGGNSRILEVISEDV